MTEPKKEVKTKHRVLFAVLVTALLAGFVIFDSVTSDDDDKRLSSSGSSTVTTSTITEPGDTCESGQTPTLVVEQNPLSSDAATAADLTDDTFINIRSTVGGIFAQGTVQSSPYIVTEQFTAPEENRPTSDSPYIENRCLWAIDVEDKNGTLTTYILQEIGVVQYNFGWNPTVYTTAD